MTNPTVYPSGLQWVGLAKESVYGTAISAPTVWVPVMAPKWEPHETMLKDIGWRGNMAKTQGQVAGVRYDTLDYKCNLFLGSAYQHFLNALGGTDSVTGSGDPYTHKTSLGNSGNGQPVSYTLFLYNGAETWQMAGSQINTLDLETKVADSLAELTVQWMGLPAVKMGSNPTNTPDTTAPMPSWNTTLTIGGTATTNYSDIKLGIKRNAEAIFTSNGTQSPYVIFVGEAEVTGDLTAVYEGYAGTVSDLANYIANTQPIVVAKVSPAGDATHYLQITGSKTGYDSAVADGSGKYIQVTSKLEFLANATDVVSPNTGASPIQVQILNAVATY